MKTADPGIARLYLRFADEEAHGRSPLYEEFARHVAGDPGLHEFLLTLPREKRQPNLLFAALRHVAGTASGWGEFRNGVMANRDRVRDVMLARSTQTNEPGRCAVLLPVLARLPQPLALIEIGASAGLCLLPDRYAYDYGGRGVRPSGGGEGSPVFPCRANAATPLPEAVPRIAWRAGLDLNPIDLADPEAASWLEMLVWPGQPERAARLGAAMTIAALDPPRVVQGDLRRDLAALAAEAPAGATRVVFHSAVLAYLPGAERGEFARSVRDCCDVWIANEAAGVFPDIASRAARGPKGWFLLSVNGEPVAWTDPHGVALDWIA
jgi:hypothetical protein